MRILHATDTFWPMVGGIEVMVRTLAERQAAAGHTVTVVARTPAPGSGDPAGPLTICRDPTMLAGLVKDADVVHGHVSAYSPLALHALEAGGRRGIPTVATVHSVWGRAWPLFRGAAAVRGWAYLPIRWAAVSSIAAAPVRRALGGTEVLVLPNGVDTGFWAPSSAPAGRPGVTIVAAMRMARRKRPLELVSMLARARRLLGPDAAVVAHLVGDGPLLPAVRRAIRDRGLQSWVHTSGDLGHDALRELYAGADIFLAPARLESFGLAALEARAAGLCVLARDGTGISGFVSHGREGLLSSGDGEMVRQLAGVCRDDRLRLRITGHNQAVPPALDWSSVLGLHDEAYAEAAMMPRTGPLTTGAALAGATA
jgi:glycosyltransferase involved in cell wall biosynthesis